MVTVQAAGCAPIVEAFHNGERFARDFPSAATVASGLRVPRAIGDFLILDTLRQSKGTAVAVTDDELIAATGEIGAVEGLFCAPEGAACLPGLRQLLASCVVKPDESVVLFNIQYWRRRKISGVFLLILGGRSEIPIRANCIVARVYCYSCTSAQQLDL
jgi:threonine synthase